MTKKIKSALVTGGTRGIGLGIVKELIAEGFHVTALGTRDAESYEEFKKLLDENEGILFYVKGDVSSDVDRKNAVSEAVKNHGRIDLLVNNAGVAPKVRADLLELSEESMDRLFKINTKGTFFLAQEMSKVMLDQEEIDGLRGTIINISSVSSTFVSVNRADYCISKASISMITKLLASRLAKEKILVYEIQPGIIESDMTSGVKEKYDNLFEDGIALISRWGKPEDIGKAVCVLAEGKLLYTTGQILYLDGGMNIPQL